MPFVRPRVEPSAALMARLHAVLASGHLSNGGPCVRELEVRLGDRLGCQVLAVANGTVALQAALSLVQRPGRVVIPSFTFLATANAVRAVGRDLVFCDVDPGRWTLDPSSLAALLDAHDDIAAVVAVNVYGQPAPMAAIVELCRPRDIDVFIDNAHGFGSSEAGQPWPDGVRAAAHSMHATKVLPAAEGGFVAVASEQDGARIAKLRNHGHAEAPGDIEPGFNAKLSELHAAVALEGLATIDQVLAERRGHLRTLRESVLALPGQPLQLQAARADVVENGQNFVVATPPGACLRWADALAELGIGSRRYFWPSLTAISSLAGSGVTPVADAVAARVLALPLWSGMSAEDVARLASSLAIAAARCQEAR